MQKFILAVAMLLSALPAFTQNSFPASGAVGIGTTTPASSSILDIRSTSRGVLLPRMTKAQRAAIGSPAQGLLVFQTDGSRGFYVFDGSWQPMSVQPNLANLSGTTAINTSLLPGATNLHSLGSSSRAWKDLYLRGDIYLDGFRYITSKNTPASVFVGANSGNQAITGEGNTAVGVEALANTTTGRNNVAVGFQAMRFNDAGDGEDPSSIGAGYENTAVGYKALSGGWGNTAIGYMAMASNSTAGDKNTAIGHSALYQLGKGGSNVAVGYATMYQTSNGTGNTAVGNNALGAVFDGSGNSALGEAAGAHAADVMEGTFLGAHTSAEQGLSNFTVIGYGVTVNQSNQVRVGNEDITSIGGKVGWTTFSDGRYKQNLRDNVPGLAFINRLKPLTYTLNIAAIKAQAQSTISNNRLKGDVQQPQRGTAYNQSGNSAQLYTGFVAQEVAAIADSLHYQFSGVDKPEKENGFYGLRYAEFVVPLVKAVQELHSQMEAENKSLKEELAALKKMVQELQKTLMPSTHTNSKAYLEQNAPNPVQGSSIIHYSAPIGTRNLSLQISNTKGQVVLNASLNKKGAGQYQIDSGRLAAGVYTYTLIADGQVAGSRNMIVIK